MSRSARKHNKKLARVKQKAKEGRAHGCGHSKTQEPPNIFRGFRRRTVEKAQRGNK